MKLLTSAVRVGCVTPPVQIREGATNAASRCLFTMAGLSFL
jgi:hypothetical protein